MSYLDHQQSLKQRAASGAAVAAIQASVALVLITGLTIAVVKPEPVPNPEGYTEVPLPPPPPEDKPQPKTEAPAREPVAPLPPIPLPPTPGPTAAPFERDEPIAPYVAPTATPTPAPAPYVQPSPRFTPKRAAPIGSPGSWISTDDYPAGPLRRGVEGTAGYRLVIGSNGQVTTCELTRSTGNTQLDDATCRYLTRRARFSPATDGNGANVVGTYTGTVHWQIPE